MGIVHHANYLRYCEEARVLWLEENDEPYTWYMANGLHFAVTRVELDYHASARFDDRLEIATWVEAIRGASLRMGYRTTRGDEVLVTGATEHAAVDGEGRVRRIPKERRISMQEKLRLQD
jgi:acyl-CoA thioester hydrolase